jgi:hypothetical protein
VVDLASLTRFENNWVKPESKLEARNRGTIKLNPFATGFVNVDIIVNPTGAIDAQTVELSNGATISGDGTLAANVTNNRGIVIPGSLSEPTIAVLTVDGNYTQEAGAMADTFNTVTGDYGHSGLRTARTTSRPAIGCPCRHLFRRRGALDAADRQATRRRLNRRRNDRCLAGRTSSVEYPSCTATERKINKQWLCGDTNVTVVLRRRHT